MRGKKRSPGVSLNNGEECLIMSSLGEYGQRKLADSGSNQDGHPEGQGSEEASDPESLDRARQADARWCKVQDVGEQVVPRGLRETKWSKKRSCENIPTNNQEKLGENKGTRYELSRMGIIVITGQRFPI